MSARTRFFTGPIRGRTHRSAPTRWGKRSGDNGNWHGKRTFPLRGDERAARRGRRALRVVAESRRDCPGQRRTAERLRRGREGWVGIGAEITPKRGHQPRTIPQSRLRRASSLYTREPLGTGADCRVASLLAMTVLNLCHSEEAQRADVGIRLFYDGRWTGVRAAESSAPTEGLPKSRQRADVGIGPYGKPDQPPKPAGAQRSVRARGREGWAEIAAKTIPKGGPPPRLPGQRSERGKRRWSNSVFAR